MASRGEQRRDGDGPDHRSVVAAFLAAHPSASLALVQRLGQRLRHADAKLVEFASLDALGRVAVRLTELCERFGRTDGGHVELLLPITQEELAGWTGASLESVARALQTMWSLGWIEKVPANCGVIAYVIRGAPSTSSDRVSSPPGARCELPTSHRPEVIVQSLARRIAVPRRSSRWPRRRPRRQSEATRRQNAELAAWPPDRYGTGRRLGDQWSHMWWRQ